MRARFLLAALAITSYAPTVSMAASGPVPVATFDQKPVIVSAADGTLLAWFVRTSAKGQAVTVRESRDHGSTWTEESTRLALPAEPGLWGGLEALVDRSGEVHLFITNDAKTAKKPFRRKRYDIWHVKSEAGRTKWQQPKRIWQGYTGALNSVIQLSSGRILLPFSYLTQRTWRNRGEGLDAFTYRGQFDCTLVYSDDNGDSWQQSTSSLKVTTPDIVSAYGGVEPVVLELKDGRVWMLIRTQLGRFYQSHSDDGAAWSAPRPTRILSSDSPAGLVRLADSRIVLIWNKCLRFPYAHGGRHVLHAAISNDEGRTWRGCREVAWDPLRADPPPPSGDHGTAYPFPVAVKDGSVIFTTGQGAGRILCMRLDPAWLDATRREDDFARGLRDWSVFGTKGVDCVPHPRSDGRSVLRVRRTHDAWPAAAVWNFPAGVRGRLRLQILLEPGFGGAVVGITDHFSVPFDDEAELHNLLSVPIDAEGTVAGKTHGMRTGLWVTLEIAWDGAERTGAVSLDGQALGNVPLSRTTDGACYLRLRSTGPSTGAGGLLVASVAADVSASYERTDHSE